ncbi:hypothetical protein ACFL3V_01055 [Nanoarchaeota archaeon]
MGQKAQVAIEYLRENLPYEDQVNMSLSFPADETDGNTAFGMHKDHTDPEQSFQKFGELADLCAKQVKAKPDAIPEVYECFVGWRFVSQQYRSFKAALPIMDQAEEQHSTNADLLLEIGRAYVNEAINERKQAEYNRALTLTEKGKDLMTKATELGTSADADTVASLLALADRNLQHTRYLKAGPK